MVIEPLGWPAKICLTLVQLQNDAFVILKKEGMIVVILVTKKKKNCNYF